MIEVTIDGQKIEVPERTTILHAAKELGIWIPTLCYHEALSPWGACRICIVEIKSGKRTKMVTACNFPIEGPIEVFTDSERVQMNRRMSMELLLARCPNVPAIKELGEKLGITETRFPKEDKYCILCGQCISVCEEVIGRSAIQFVDRGIETKPETPFLVVSDECIGCGACAYVCPTGVIYMSDEGGVRKIKRWHAEFELVRCKECGKPITTKQHIDYLKEKISLPDYIFELCGDCKKQFYLEKTFSLGHM